MYETSTQFLNALSGLCFLNALSGLCGYIGYGVTRDGGVLCEPCMHKEQELICEAINDRNDPQWEVVAIDAHWEGDALQCDHCYGSIEPNYE